MDSSEEMELDLEELMLSSSSEEVQEVNTPPFQRTTPTINPILRSGNGEMDTFTQESSEKHNPSPCLVCSF